jgi:23S rRNA pseudouridine1911/1915/1917 synthase
LLLVARKQDAYLRLTADLAARRIQRRYLTLVHGEMDMPTGTIDAPIGRDPAHPTRKRISGEGRPARSHYRVVAAYSGVSLLEVTLETGRTHQIRVHFAGIGHPVVGDRTYSRKADPIKSRLFLHAAKLELAHPRTHEDLFFEAPLPNDLNEILLALGRLPS